MNQKKFKAFFSFKLYWRPFIKYETYKIDSKFDSPDIHPSNIHVLSFMLILIETTKKLEVTEPVNE